MASPQLENGHIKIANEIFEALMLCCLTQYERAVVDAVLRKTYGWGKKSDWISNSQLSDLTGIARPNITRTVKTLIKKKIVVKTGKFLSFQKDWEGWKVEWRRQPQKLSHQITKVISPDNKKLSREIPTKDNKDTIQNGEQSSHKNMAWKKYNENDHTDDLPAIDLDSREEVKKPEKVKRHYKEVYAIFRKIIGISEMNEIDWVRNTTEQKAADLLWEKKGKEKIVTALVFYRENKDQEFCPHAFSPSLLVRNWDKLLNYKKKNN